MGLLYISLQNKKKKKKLRRVMLLRGIMALHHQLNLFTSRQSFKENAKQVTIFRVKMGYTWIRSCK